MDDSPTLVISEILDITSDEDENSPDPFDVIVHTVGDITAIVVADCNNSSVKSLYTKGGKICNSVLKLENFPWKLAKVKANQMAVTVPGMRSIVLFETNPDLKKQGILKTREMYWGLAAINGITLIAGSDFSPCIDFLDLDGNVLKCILAEDIGQSLLQEPDILYPNPDGNILIVDSGSRCLFGITQSGQVQFVYSLEEKCPGFIKEGPHGVTVSTSGSVYLIDDAKHTLTELTVDGKFVKEVSIPGEKSENYFGLCCDENFLYIAVRKGHIKICTIV